MDTNAQKTSATKKKSRIGCLQIAGILAAVVIIGFLLGAWWVKYNIYANEFKPTKLTEKEQKILDAKLALLDDPARVRQVLPDRKKRDSLTPLTPEAYSEEGASRDVRLSERELNALIANDPEMAQRVAVDLSDSLVSLKLVMPIDEDVIFFGGKTLRLSMGVVLKYEDNQLVVALRGISLGGIPIPNAWLGHLKNKNLIEEFGDEGGFWELFAEGVENINVREGNIEIRLKE